MIKNKKGITHVETILSFVIFIGFVIFLLAMFNPFKNLSSNEVYFDIAKNRIKSNISITVDFLTLKLNESVNECFYFNYNSSLKNITIKTVKNENYELVNAFSREEQHGRTGDEERVYKTIYINGGGIFFYIYSSEEFNESVFCNNDECDECIEIEEENYTLGMFRSYDMVSYVKLESFKNSYENNYENLKKEAGLPAGKDFSFSVRETLQSTQPIILSVEKKIPKVRVFSGDEPIQIVYANGTIKYALLNLQIW